MIPYSTVSNQLNNCGVGTLDEVIKVLPAKWLHRYIDPITQFIEIFMRNSESGFDAKELQMRIEQETMLTVGYSFIKNLPKRQFKLNYKKRSPRPYGIDLLKQNYVRTLFCKEFINIIEAEVFLLTSMKSRFPIKQSTIIPGCQGEKVLKSKTWTTKARRAS